MAFGVISGLTHSANGTFLQRVAPAHATLIFIAAGLVMVVTAALGKRTTWTHVRSLPACPVPQLEHSLSMFVQAIQLGSTFLRDPSARLSERGCDRALAQRLVDCASKRSLR